MFKKICIIVISVVVLILLVCVLGFAFNNNEDNNQTTASPDDKLELIVPTSVIMYKGESTAIETNVVNKNKLAYTLKYSTSSEIIELSYNIILAKNIGTAQVIVTLTYKDVKITKVIQVKVHASLTDAEIVIRDKSGTIDKIMYESNKTFYLDLHHNLTLLNNLTYTYSSNINNFKLISTSDYICTYSFTVNFGTECKFTFTSDAFATTKTIACNKMIDSFKIKTSNNVLSEGTIKLFLFNNTYVDEANLNNKFSFSNYSISVPEFCLKSYTFTSSNSDICLVTDNKISAISSGRTTLEFVATDSSDFKAIIFVEVNKIHADNIIIASNISAEINTPCKIISKLYPIYALCEIELTSTSLDVTCNGDTITGTKSGDFVISAKCPICNAAKQFTVSIIDTNYKFHFSVTTGFENTVENYTFNNNKLLVKSNSANVIIPFWYVIKNNDDKLYNANLSCNIELVTLEGKPAVVENISNSLTIYTTGKCSLVLNVKCDNISSTIFIEIT